MCLTAKNTNYNIDEVVDDNSAPPEEKLDFLAYTRKVAAAKKAEKDVEVLMESAAFHVPEVTDFEVDIFDPYQKYRLYDIAGSVLHSLKSMNITTCDGCFEALLWRGPGSHRFATIVSLREYKKGCLYSVSDECFLVIVKAEITFRKTRDELKSVKHINAVKFLVEKLQYAWEGTKVPSCHDITTKVLHRFLTKRFKMYALQSRKTLKKKKPTEDTKYSSKTMGMHAAVE